MHKAVLDTNLFVSSVITQAGPASQLLHAWRDHKYILITSWEIIQEMVRVLRYPHIKNKYRLKEEDTESLIHLIEHEAVVCPGTFKVNIVKEDPEDNKILACALEADADYIVSGDHHLLNLRRYRNIAIVTAREFLKIIH